MRDIAQGIYDQVIQIFEECGRGVWQRAEVGKISRTAKAKAEHFQIAMPQRHGNDLHAHQLERAIDDVKVHAGNSALRGRFIEHIGKGATNHAKSFFRAVDRQRGFLANVEGANVVEAEDVVGMAVGEQNGVEAVETDAQGLLTKVGCGVDDDVWFVARKQQGRAKPIVVGVLRGADAAATRERRHAHRGARAKHGDFYRSGRHNLTRLYRGGAACGAGNAAGGALLL